MKFLCMPCDEVMAFAERQLPGDGTLTAIFTCPGCKREMALQSERVEIRRIAGVQDTSQLAQFQQEPAAGIGADLLGRPLTPVGRDLRRQ